MSLNLNMAGRYAGAHTGLWRHMGTRLRLGSHASGARVHQRGVLAGVPQLCRDGRDRVQYNQALSQRCTAPRAVDAPPEGAHRRRGDGRGGRCRERHAAAGPAAVLRQSLRPGQQSLSTRAVPFSLPSAK